MIGRMLAVCPTFNRVDMCAQMVESFKKTVVDKNYFDAELVLGMSENDLRLPDYLKLCQREGLGAYVSKENSITKIINEIYVNAKNYQYFHLTNDDVLYRTENWHFIFMMLLHQKGGGIFYGNDLLQGKNLCTFPIISRNVVDAVGWLQYPRLACLCGDVVWLEIGAKTPCLYYHDQVIIEHLSWINEKREHDKPEYQGNFLFDQVQYAWFVEHELKDTLERVRKALNV